MRGPEAVIAAWLLRRNTAFENDDLSWAAETLPPEVKPEVVAAAFHKARVHCEAVSIEKRNASLSWLQARGWRPSVSGIQPTIPEVGEDTETTNDRR